MSNQAQLESRMLRALALAGLLAVGTGPIRAEQAGKAPDGQVHDQVRAVELTFGEREPGQEEHFVRVLVTPGHLRMDDGTGGPDFVLLDRQARVLFSTDSERRSVLTVAYRQRDVESPIPLEMDEGMETMADAPQVAGTAPVHRYLEANGTRCYDTISVPGLLEDAVAAMGEMRQVLASEHARVLGSLPADVHEPCDLAVNLFKPTWPMQAGLPLREWSAGGYRRVLRGYREDAEVKPALFVLPQAYDSFVIGEGS